MESSQSRGGSSRYTGDTFDLYSKIKFRQEFTDLNYSFIKGNPKEVVVDSKVIEKQMEFIEKVHSIGAEVLLSNHSGIVMTAIVENPF